MCATRDYRARPAITKLRSKATLDMPENASGRQDEGPFGPAARYLLRAGTSRDEL
jgi:hypothetical protein